MFGSGPRCRITLLLCFVFLTFTAFGQSTTGSWSSQMTWPGDSAGWVPTHVILLPNGKVMFSDSYGDGGVIRQYDPATNAVSTLGNAPYNIFCQGHVQLGDGRLFSSGGHIQDFVGFPHASIYNWQTNTWTQVPDMNAGRWYPTNTTLSNGDVLAISGTIDSSSNYNEIPQVYQAATNSWRTLSSAQFHTQTYPLMFLAPNGKVFLAGWNPDTRYLNTSGTGAWTFVANSIHGWRNYGTAVMYDAGKILLIGGGGDNSTNSVTNTAEKIDLNAATPTWTAVASMHYARRQLNSTVLPDGTVLVTGGSSANGFDVYTGAVLPAELYNPSTNTWTVMASMSNYRGYHSWALLLPDARVLVGGGQLNLSGANNGSNAQIFSPPYLFKGARPTITSAPGSVAYGQTALIGTADAVARVTWIRLGAVTHSFNQDQRFMSLSFAATTGGVNVTFPSSANLSPPGYYMLFLLNSTGVPSVAKIIKIGGTSSGGTGTLSGTVTNASTGAAIAGATVSFSGGSTTTSSTGTYSFSNVATGSYTVTASASGFTSSSQPATVNSGATTTLNFGLTASSGGSTGTLSGTVTNASTGAAIAGATVSFSGGSTTTSSTGTYSFSNVATGSYTVTASASGFNSSSQSATVNAGATTTLNFGLSAASAGCQPSATVPSVNICSPANGATVPSPVTVSAAAHLASAVKSMQVWLDGVKKFEQLGVSSISTSLAMAAGAHRIAVVAVDSSSVSTKSVVNITVGSTTATGTLSGTVTNAGTGAAIAGATVSYSGGSTTTNSSGGYTLSNVAAGTYTVTASASGFTSSSQSATVNAGATTTANFGLTASGGGTGTLTGLVTNASTGAAISGATVSYSGGSTTTNSSGAYSFTSVAAGTYTVTASASGFNSSSQSATVNAGASTTANFGLTASSGGGTGTITGKVTNVSNGAALSGATVSYSGGSTTTDTTGTYTLANVAAGTYTVTASRSGYLSRSQSVTVTAGATTTANFPLATSGKIAGTVTNTSGTAISGATVTISGGSVATTVTLTTSSTGTYSSSWIPIGTYTVTVSKTGLTTQSKSASVTAGATTTVNFTMQ